MTEGTQTQQFPCPDPALRRLDRWKTEGHLPDSDEEHILAEIVIRGETSFRWLPGGFFLEQHRESRADRLRPRVGDISLNGLCEHRPSAVAVSVGGRGHTLKISVLYGPLDATFTGSFSEDGQSFGGGGAPIPAPRQ
jgi:hypothetical protein